MKNKKKLVSFKNEKRIFAEKSIYNIVEMMNELVHERMNEL